MEDNKKKQIVDDLIRKGFTPQEAALAYEEAAKVVEKDKNPSKPATVTPIQPKASNKYPAGYEEPEWFNESGLDYKQENKIRTGMMRQLLSVASFGTPIKIQPVKDQSDVLSPEMVMDVDAISRTADKLGLDETAATIKANREALRKKYNPLGSKAIDRNIDILLEEALAPKITSQIENEMESSGVTKRDMILSDPKLLKEAKASYRDKGWSGDIIDRAFYKVVNEDYEGYLASHQKENMSKAIATISEQTGRPYEEVANEHAAELEKERIDRAESLFGKDELERRKLVKELEYLNAQPEKNVTEIRKREERIKEIQKRLNLDVDIDWTGTAANMLGKAPLLRGKNPLAFRYTYGEYDENGNRINRSKMSQEAQDRESEVVETMNDIKEHPNYKEMLTTSAREQYLVLKDLELEQKALDEEINTLFTEKFGINIRSRNTYTLPIIGSRDMNFQGEEKEAWEEYERKSARVKELRDKAEVKFEAFSRMELLNQSVALEDKTLSYYLEDAGKTFVDLNNIKKKGSAVSAAERTEVAREIYSSMGIKMTDEELEATAPNIKLDLTRGLVNISDFALKAAAVDALFGYTGAPALLEKLKSAPKAVSILGSYLGKSNKLIAGAGEAALEGAKFAIISGDKPAEKTVGGFETGAAFYAVGKLMPNIKGLNPAMNAIVNGLIKSSAAMTASMEAVHAYEVGRDAIANDKNFERALEENGVVGFGDADEVSRRIIVEAITALPFGVRSLTTLRQYGYTNTKPEELIREGRRQRGLGNEELGLVLETAGLEGISPAANKRALEIKDKIEFLREEGLYEPSKSIEKNLEKYKEKVEELGYDPIKDQMVEGHDGRIFGQSAIRDVVESHEKIEYLKGRGLELQRKSRREIDKMFEEQKAKDKAEADALDAKIMAETIRQEEAINGKLESPAPKRKLSEEEIELENLKREIKEKKKEDGDWEQYSEAQGNKLKEIFQKFRKRVGEKNFIAILNDAIGIAKSSKEGREKEFELLPKEGFTGRSALDSFLHIVKSMKSDDVKSDAMRRIEFLEDVMGRMQNIVDPQRGYIRAISLQPSPKDMVTLPELELLKQKFVNMREGSKYGRKEYEAKMEEVKQFIDTNQKAIIEFAGEVGINKQELDALTAVLPATASPRDVAVQIQRIQRVINRMGARAVKARINRDIQGNLPKINQSSTPEATKVDFITSEKLETIDALWNNDMTAAAELMAKYRTLRNDAILKGNAFEADLYMAHINALRVVGNRDIALERINELNDKIDSGETLTPAERMEYEVLEFTDGKRMTLNDLYNAHDNLKAIISTGRNTRELELLDKKIMNESEVEAALESILGEDYKNFSADKKEFLSQALKISSDRNRKGAGAVQSMKDFRAHQESLYTMMEYLMRDMPNRMAGEGSLHSITNDVLRARQHKDSAIREKMALKHAKKLEIFGVETKDLKKINKAHTEYHPLEITVNGRKQEVDAHNVNEVYKVWQNTLMEGTSNGFFDMGWGVKIENGKAVYDPQLLRSELEAFMDRYSPVGAKKMTEYATWQVQEFFPQYFPRINEAARAKRGADIIHEANYSPVIREVDAEGKKIETKALFEGENNFFVQTIMPSGLKVRQRNPMTKINTHIDGELLIQKYVDKMEHFINFQPVVDRMRNVFGDPTVRSIIEYKNSKEYLDAIDGMIDRISGDTTRTGETKLDKLLDGIRRRTVGAYLGLNVSLFPKQVAALPAYLYAVKGGEIFDFMSKLAPTKDMVESYKELLNSEFVRNRIKTSSYDRDVIEVVKHLNNASERYDSNPRILTGDWKQDMLISTKLGDLFTILWGGQAVYRISRDKYLKQGMSVHEAKQKAYQDFLVSSVLTQAEGSVENLSTIQSAGSLGKAMTLFQNTPLQYMRIEAMAVTNGYRAARQMREAKTPQEYAVAKAKLAKSAKDFVVFHFVLPALFTTMSKLFYVGEDKLVDDPDLLTNMTLGSAAYVFIIGDFVRTALDLAYKGKAFAPSVIGTIDDMGDTFLQGLEAIKQIIESGEVSELDLATDVREALKPIAEVAGLATGLPAPGALKWATGISDFISGKSNDPRSLLGFSGASMGDYSRSPEYKFMSKFLREEAPVDDFLDDIKGRMSKEDYSKNKDRLKKEYKMYLHFGGGNSVVNTLYRGGLDNEKKANYLLKMKRGSASSVYSIGGIVNAATMTPPEWDKMIEELKKYDVISNEVIKIIRKKEQGE